MGRSRPAATLAAAQKPSLVFLSLFCCFLSGRRRGENNLGDSLFAPGSGIPGKTATLDEPVQDGLVLGEKPDGFFLDPGSDLLTHLARYLLQFLLGF